ncbi:hypothetical protein [Chryseobacterium wanjuense]
MKKVILLVAFGVTGLISAKNSVKKEFNEKENAAQEAKTLRLCGICITYYDSAGNVSDIKFFTSDQPNLNSCMAWQNGQIAAVQQAGYNVSVNP